MNATGAPATPPSLPNYSEFRELGRLFAAEWDDFAEGLQQHPIQAGYQATVMRLFSDAGRFSGQLGFDEQEHHAFVAGCRQGLGQRRG